MTHTAIELTNAPEVLNVKVDQIGETNYKDENSAIYFRVDYEREFIDEEEDERLVYYGNGTVFYDGLFNAEHGSTPDAYPNGLKENEAVKVDFSAADGVNVKLADYAPRDWSGNIRVIAYLQNPGAHNTGVQVKMQLRDPSKEISIGIKDITSAKTFNASNAAYNLQGQRVSINTKGLIIVNGKKHFNK